MGKRIRLKGPTVLRSVSWFGRQVSAIQCWVLQQLGPKLDLAISYVLCQSLAALSIHCRSIHVAIPISFEHVVVRHGVFILILSHYLRIYRGDQLRWRQCSLGLLGNAPTWSERPCRTGTPFKSVLLSWVAAWGVLFFLWFDVKWCTEKVGPFSPFPGHLRRSGPGEEGFALLLGISEGSSFDAPGPVGSCWIRPESPATWRRVRRRPGSATHGHVS